MRRWMRAIVRVCVAPDAFRRSTFMSSWHSSGVKGGGPGRSEGRRQSAPHEQSWSTKLRDAVLTSVRPREGIGRLCNRVRRQRYMRRMGLHVRPIAIFHVQP
jgi:hypothetical protein